jgi:antitoxin ParD1/3/4
MTVVSVTLSADLAQFVEAEIARGDYDSVNAVFNDALRAMMAEREDDVRKQAVLMEAVLAGLADVNAGRFSTRSVYEIAQDVLRT